MPMLRIGFRSRRFFSEIVKKHVLDKPISAVAKAKLNIKSICAKPEVYSQYCQESNHEGIADSPFKIRDLHSERIKIWDDVRPLRPKIGALEAELSNTTASLGESDRTALVDEARGLKEKIQVAELKVNSLSNHINSLAFRLPNLPTEHTPRGNKPILVEKINKPPSHDSIIDADRRDHVRIGDEFDLIDFASATKTSGWGWYYLKDEAAMLEQALIQYALQVAMQHGFSFVSPPSMTYSHLGPKCGFHPRDSHGEQQVYSIQQTERDQEKGKSTHSLAGTAEIPFAALYADQTLQHTDLPRKIVGSSRCYRAEAGARGQKTKGLYRVHEFTKVEMFAWTMPGEELEMFNTILKIQKQILGDLGLHCQVLEMPSTDLGHSAARKQDIEAYFPSRKSVNNGFGEVTSTSICTDYQTRRMNTRVKMPMGGESKTAFPSTVNGTALAVPRVLAALLEHGWDAKEDCVHIPPILWPWMFGKQVIRKPKVPRSTELLTELSAGLEGS